MIELGLKNLKDKIMEWRKHGIKIIDSDDQKEEVKKWKRNNRKSLTQNEFVVEQGWMAALVRDRKKFPLVFLIRLTLRKCLEGRNC